MSGQNTGNVISLFKLLNEAYYSYYDKKFF